MNNTNKPLILFDIDLTLYNTNHFRILYPPLMAKAMNISIETLAQTQKSYTGNLEKSTDFLPEDYLRHISQSHSYPYQKLHDIYFNRQLFIQSIYPDTIPALEKLKSTHILGIYSEGETKFQTTKLKLSGILDYFNPDYIFIHHRKLDNNMLNMVPGNSVIVDDNLEVFKTLTSYTHTYGFNPIWLNRKDKNQHSSTPTIHSLLDLI